MWTLRDRLLVDIVREVQDQRRYAEKVKDLQYQMSESRRFIWRPKTDRNIEFFTKLCSTIYRSLDEISDMEHIEPEWNRDVCELHQNFLHLKQKFQKYKQIEHVSKKNFIFDSIYKLSEESEAVLDYLKQVLPQHVIRLRRAAKERRSQQHQDIWSILKSMHLCLSKTRNTGRIEVPFVKRIEKLSRNLLAKLIKILHGKFEFTDLNEQASLEFDLLFYGLQCFISTEFALMELRAQLAEHFFQEGYVAKCNEFAAELNFGGLKILFSKREDDKEINWNDHYLQLFEKLKVIIKRILELPKASKDVEIRKLLNLRLRSLTVFEESIEEAASYFMEESPRPINTEMAKFEQDSKVSYCIQLKCAGKVSKLSLWSKPLLVDQKACPILHMPQTATGQVRLIYRKLDNKASKFVGELSEPLELNFKDINRELYDLAKCHNNVQLAIDFDRLLRAGADLNATFENGRNLLHATAQFSNIFLLKLMLESKMKCDLNAVDHKGYTALHIATAYGHTNFVISLLELNLNVNVQTKKDLISPLHLAVFNGKPKILKHLLKAENSEVNIKDKAGFTALHYATNSGKVELIAKLCSNPKIDINAQSNAGITALHIAVLNHDMEMTKFLLKQPKIDVNLQTAAKFTALFFAAMASNFKIFKLLLTHPTIDVNLRTLNDFTVLHFCIILNRIEFFEELFKLKSLEVSANAVGNITPLHISIMLDHSNFVLALLKAGCELDTQSKTEGFTALHVAIRFGRPGLLLLVIAHGPKLELKTTKEKDTPLALATPPSKDYDTTCLRYLIQNGADFYYFCR